MRKWMDKGGEKTEGYPCPTQVTLEFAMHLVFNRKTTKATCDGVDKD